MFNTKKISKIFQNKNYAFYLPLPPKFYNKDKIIFFAL